MTQQYDPFLYPPNYELARLHKNCSMPGISVPSAKVCPCCSKKQRKPFKEWITRSIDQDFKNYGGSVVTYFWLLKLYIIVIGIILVLYSIYLTFAINQNCSDQVQQCKKMFGIWILSNQSLIKILKSKDQQSTIVRLLTLRGIAFIILMLTNAFSLIVVKKFKQIHPTKLTIADYSLIFKNTNLQPQEMILKLKLQFPEIQIKQILKIHELEPFYTLYQQKLETYYQAINSNTENIKPKEIQRIVKKLRKLNQQCAQNEEKFHQQKGQRIIVTFQSIEMRKWVLEQYQQNYTQKFKTLFYSKDSDPYCVQAPQPEQIIWHNIGSGDKYKAKYKLLSVVYFFALLGFCYLILFLCMSMVYGSWFSEPWNTIVINVILFFLVYMALTFRAFMNRLSQLSHPSTYTNRTMFIVLTTVSFHLLFYLAIPTVYFSAADSEEHKNDILKMISNQVFNFIVFQFIIVGVDLMHCCWNRRLKAVEDQQNPFACQSLLHSHMQYPRFPIQFKLIILFKIWSFTIFFSFQSPFILIFLFIALIFLFIKDKHSIYFHYRMEIIDNKVQFKFLKIYTIFFSLYGFFVFVLTQRLEIELWMAAGFTVAMILVQFFWIGKSFETKQSRFQEDGVLLLPPSYDELENKQSYRKKFINFVQRIQNDAIDIQINDFLGNKSIKSLKTQDVL